MNKIPAVIREAVLGSNSNSQDDDSRDDARTLDSGYSVLIDDDESLNAGSHDGYSESVSEHSEPNSLEDTLRPLESLPEVAPLADELKVILEKDYLDVVMSDTIYTLPFAITIKQILDDFKGVVEEKNYVEFVPRCGAKPPKENPLPEIPLLIDEFVNSTSIYFDTVALTNLFYNTSEREAYQKLAYQLSPSNCFGLVHLLRFVVLFPDFMASSTSIPKKQMRVLVSMFDCFTYYLSRNYSKYL